LNGSIGQVFTDWVRKVFPDRADKVIHGIEDCHGGKLSDSRAGIRMRGEGHTAEMIRQMATLAKQRFFATINRPKLNTELFMRNKKGQLSIF
jgi:DNA repair photolyase